MSGPPSTPTTKALAAGYALHALEPEDEQRLSAHLLTCHSCARLVADTAVARARRSLSCSTPEPPPPGLRARILAAATAEPRGRPRPASHGPMAPPTSTRRPLAPAPIRPSAPAAAGPRSLPGSAGCFASARRRGRSRCRHRRRRRRPGDAGRVPPRLSRAAPQRAGAVVAGTRRPHGHPDGQRQRCSGEGRRDRPGHLPACRRPPDQRCRRSTVYVLWAANAAGVSARPVATFDVHGSAPVAAHGRRSCPSARLTDPPGWRSRSSRAARRPRSPTDVVLSGTAA